MLIRSTASQTGFSEDSGQLEQEQVVSSSTFSNAIGFRS
jgi:hypothetical protein